MPSVGSSLTLHHIMRFGNQAPPLVITVSLRPNTTDQQFSWRDHGNMIDR